MAVAETILQEFARQIGEGQVCYPNGDDYSLELTRNNELQL